LADQNQQDTDAAGIANRIHAGDRSAEAALIERFFEPMLALLRFRCHDAAVADDLCQDTFRIAIEQLRSKPLDNPAALSGYLRQVAMNLFINEIRRHDRQRTATDQDAVERHMAEQRTAYEEIRREQDRITVETLLATLSVDRDRQILRLYYLAELDKDEICRRLELSPAHFDRVIYRARQRLREAWEKNRPPGGRIE
jgi:RNA polymerase sigma-70 factor (ECF subfamily)